LIASQHPGDERPAVQPEEREAGQRDGQKRVLPVEQIEQAGRRRGGDEPGAPVREEPPNQRRPHGAARGGEDHKRGGIRHQAER
jgi:hypothetical protein